MHEHSRNILFSCRRGLNCRAARLEIPEFCERSFGIWGMQIIFIQWPVSCSCWSSVDNSSTKICVDDKSDDWGVKMFTVIVDGKSNGFSLIPFETAGFLLNPNFFQNICRVSARDSIDKNPTKSSFYPAGQWAGRCSACSPPNSPERRMIPTWR